MYIIIFSLQKYNIIQSLSITIKGENANVPCIMSSAHFGEVLKNAANIIYFRKTKQKRKRIFL
jgi:hypothetical protein